MNLLIVGDVHGCLNALKELVENNWDSENEIIVQVGDLVDRGSASPETVEYCMELKKKYGSKAVFIKGNHEFEMIEHVYNGPNHNWLRQCGNDTLIQYERGGCDIQRHIEWFMSLPLFYEDDNVFISHGGISESASDPFDEKSSQGVLWHREKLKNIGKIQIIGHTPLENNKPFFDEAANTWNIDTSAGYGGNLTAIRVSDSGEVKEIISIKTTQA